MRPFTAADSREFFGRENLVTTLLERLNENDPLGRFLAIVGPSGSGKSSPLHAGNLYDHLRRDAGGLLRAAGLILPGDGSEILLLVDQFNVTLCTAGRIASICKFDGSPPNGLEIGLGNRP